ncbi:UNVERIFIED_ORG: hypothetical protein M2435_006665 [Rhizobium sophorae]|uniref:hypothetical protein n=1 Tax=Rhizobium leguminosarum TaxID=384 RepID=UPI00160DB83A|nr:hypothetical protein [Rhizobium leguminosarum]MBB4526594.1 hypothetical protein [Rhizobium leguminosarum]MDH6663719.1 hypothetical protein [Rhizobium sophorae]
MLIKVDGNFIKGARITGPTHHFAAVEFTNSPADCKFKFMGDKSLVPDGNLLNSVIEALNLIEPMSPVNGSMYISSIYIDKNDMPDVMAYREIFQSIFLEAEKHLR